MASPLTESERKSVLRQLADLEKWNRRWPALRWVGAATAAVAVAFALLVLFLLRTAIDPHNATARVLHGGPASPREFTLEVSLALPHSLLLAVHYLALLWAIFLGASVLVALVPGWNRHRWDAAYAKGLRAILEYGLANSPDQRRSAGNAEERGPARSDERGAATP